MNHDFRYLIEDFCKRCGLDNPGRILGGGALVVNEVSFSLVHSDELNPAAVLIYCDLGEIPPGAGARFYLDLLEANAVRDDGSAFTLADDTGRVVLTDHHPLNQERSPDQLRETLVRLAAKAAAWRASRTPTRAVLAATPRRRGLNGTASSAADSPAAKILPL